MMFNLVGADEQQVKLFLGKVLGVKCRVVCRINPNKTFYCALTGDYNPKRINLTVKYNEKTLRYIVTKFTFG